MNKQLKEIKKILSINEITELISFKTATTQMKPRQTTAKISLNSVPFKNGNRLYLNWELHAPIAGTYSAAIPKEYMLELLLRHLMMRPIFPTTTGKEIYVHPSIANLTPPEIWINPDKIDEIYRKKSETIELYNNISEDESIKAHKTIEGIQRRRRTIKALYDAGFLKV